MRLALLLLAMPWLAPAADLCAPTDIHGVYGIQLSGVTRIAGPEIPIASVGRLVLDDPAHVTGVSSVNFNGLFLGNPLTGTYEFKTDCSMSLHLQDTSGAFQILAGKAEPGGNLIEVHQTDSTGVGGVMMRTADRCSVVDLNGPYDFSMTAKATPLVTEGAPGSGSAKAVVQADGAGNLLLARAKSKTTGTYTVDAECMVEASFGLAVGDRSTVVKLRGVLVEGGQTVLAVETDPEQVAAARFSR